MGSFAAARSRVPDPEHARRLARGKRRSHCARISQRPLGSGPAGGRSRARAEIAARHTFCRSLHRSLRRPHARHYGHDGLAALSQRCRHSSSQIDALAAHGQRRDGRGHVRQGTACDDDGAGVVGVEARGTGSRRRHAAARARRGRGQGADHRRTFRAAANHARICRRGGLPRLRLTRRRLPVSGYGGHGTGRRRGAGAFVATYRACALGPAGVARCRAPLGPRPAAPASTGFGRAQHSHARSHSQCHGAARGVWRIDESAHPSACHCLRGGVAAAHCRRLGRGESPGAAPCGCAAQRPAQFCHGAGISRRWRAGSDAGTAAPGIFWTRAY